MWINRGSFSALLLALFAGCGQKSDVGLPKLHPVTGVVTVNGSPVAEGSLHVRAEPDNPNALIAAELSADGKFTLFTLQQGDRSGKRYPGAPEGTYRITYSNQGMEQRPPIDLKRRYKVEASATNHWEIDLVEKQ